MSRVVVLYKDNSEHARTVGEFLREFERRSGIKLETLDPDTREGSSFAQVYDIVQYPTIVALDDDGKLLSSWPGLPLPLINEVRYYVGDL